MSNIKTTKLITVHAASKLLEGRVNAVVKDLRKCGIKVEDDLLRGDRDAFDGVLGLSLSLSEDRKTLYIIPAGNAYDPDNTSTEATVDPRSVPQLAVTDYNKKHRQAVISMSEPARTLTRVVKVNATGFTTTNDHFQSRFGVTLPRNTKFTVTDAKRSKRGVSTATVTASVPRSRTSFLVGFDEKHMFVSMLKKPVKTVEEAHEELLPKELKGRKDYVRQGEFFFVPATEKEILGIEEVYMSRELENDDFEGTDHIAGMCGVDVHGRNHLVSGEIANSRHARLFFDRWMRVIPNNEVPSRGNNWD